MKILVRATNWLGDAVMCLPAIQLLARAPGVTLSVLTGAYTARVFMHQPGVHDLWIDAPSGRLSRIRRRTGALRAARAQLAVVFPPSFSSVVPAWLAGVPRRVGYRADARSVWLTDALTNPGRDVHLTHSYNELARATLRRAGLDMGEPGVARLHVTGTERIALRAQLGTFARDGYAVVVPGAAFGPAKSWPEARYRALCSMLSRDIHVVLVGSGGDAALCERIARDVPGVHSLAGRTSLGGLFALIEGARLLIANDSGAPHAAAALGVPAIVLFGSTSPAWTAPLGRDVRVLQHKVHCNPCFRRTCPTQLECFNGIPVDDVLGEAGRILAGSPAATS